MRLDITSRRVEELNIHTTQETTHALSFLTPNTKRRTAKEFITQGRMQEVKGNNANALALYIQGATDERCFVYCEGLFCLFPQSA